MAIFGPKWPFLVILSRLLEDLIRSSSFLYQILTFLAKKVSRLVLLLGKRPNGQK
jgi:hypothetical protein